jgi:hypothetical protein
VVEGGLPIGSSIQQAFVIVWTHGVHGLQHTSCDVIASQCLQKINSLIPRHGSAKLA